MKINRYFLIAILLLWLSCVTVCAQEIDLTVDQRTRIEVGQTADIWDIEITPKCRYSIEGTTIFIDADAKPGKYEMSVAGTRILWDERKTEQFNGFVEFTIGGNMPPPDDPDEPDNPVTPVYPVDKYGLIKVAADAVAALADSDRNREVTVRMPDGNAVNVMVCEAVAAAYFDAAERIRAGELGDPQAAINAVKDQNKAILGSNAGGWPEAFGTIGQAANQLWLDGEIANVDDWAVAFDEISEGIKSVR